MITQKKYNMFVESIGMDDPVFEIHWEDISSLGSNTNLDSSLKNSLSKFLRKHSEEELLTDLYNAIVDGLQTMTTTRLSSGFLSHPDVHWRVKTPISTKTKLNRNKDRNAERPIEKIFNDLIGIRLILSDYDVWEQVKTKLPHNVTIVDLRNGKRPDDGYRAIHVYFQQDHRHYPVEIQFVSEHDFIFNEWQHDYLYKNRSINQSIGLKLRELYELGEITTEKEYEDALENLINDFNEGFIHPEIVLVAKKQGVKGCIGYKPKTRNELMYLFKELSKEFINTDIGIGAVKGTDGYSEYTPCTLYKTPDDFYDAIFDDLMKRKNIRSWNTPNHH